MQSYQTVAGEASAELVEKRSRFIGQIFRVETGEQIQEILAGLRKEHWDANHNCFGWLLREGNLQRYSDDGEPQGTAGMPILEVLRREELTDVLCVVTRYFGGTLLGAGGLVRAYSKSAKLALDAAGKVEMCQCALLDVTAPYPLYERLTRLLEEYPAKLLDTLYETQVTLKIRMRMDGLKPFTAALTELTAGAVSPVLRAEEFAAL